MIRMMIIMNDTDHIGLMGNINDMMMNIALCHMEVVYDDGF